MLACSWRNLLPHAGWLAAPRYALAAALTLAHPRRPWPGQLLLSGTDPGQDALIDWATPLRGPLLYDLASFAVLTRSADTRAARWFNEGAAGRPPAICFASRIERGIDRRPGVPPANHEGLAAAYQGMTAGSDAA